VHLPTFTFANSNHAQKKLVIFFVFGVLANLGVTPKHYISTFCVSKKIICKSQESKFKNIQNTSLFLLCVLKFQNTKDEIPKLHHGDKPSPNTKKNQNLIHIELSSNHKKLIIKN
jgi:hypothetical protein